jgi:hypothetical protein
LCDDGRYGSYRLVPIRTLFLVIGFGDQIRLVGTHLNGFSCLSHEMSGTG